MKTHTTNYTDTFIEMAEDCPVVKGVMPPVKESAASIASIQFNMLNGQPYKYDSDDVVFHCHAVKNDLTETELEARRAGFFSKGQPCLRASPLTKKYGWGVHCNAAGKVAIYGAGTPEYNTLSQQKGLKIIKAMRSKKA